MTSTPLGLMLLSAEHERAQYALVLATGAAAIGRPVLLFASQSGCHLFRADRPLEALPREALLAGRGVAGIGVLLAAAVELGIPLMACEAGLKAEGIAPAALMPGVEVTGVVSFLAALGAGQMVAL